MSSMNIDVICTFDVDRGYLTVTLRSRLPVLSYF